MTARVFANRWWIVVASLLALMVGAGPITLFAAGVFLKPVAADLGFGRGEISTAIGLASVFVALSIPFYGRLLDTRNTRAVLLTAIVAFALANAALAFLQASTVMLFALYALLGLTGTGQGPTAYSKVVSAWFDRQRGLALGVTLAGVGAGTALMPQLANFLLGHFGWRMGFVGLGATVLVVAFIPVALIIPNSPLSTATSASGQPVFPGASFSQALRSVRFWLLTYAFFIGATVINGSLIHVVPLLTDRGISVSAAVAALSVAGLALICARVFSGWCADKLYAPYIAIFFLLCPMAGIAILGSGIGAPMLGTILLGAGIGAEIDLMSFIISRYFGIRYFGTLHGFMFAFAAFGNFVGSSILGWSFQLLGSYGPAFILFEALLVSAIAIFATLGPYAYPAPHAEAMRGGLRPAGAP
jgi:MFS family permease